MVGRQLKDKDHEIQNSKNNPNSKKYEWKSL